MKAFIKIIIAYLMVAFSKLWNVQIHQSRKVRRFFMKAAGEFSQAFRMKMQCQVGTLAGSTFAARVVDKEIQAQVERPDLLLTIDDRSSELRDGEATLIVPRIVPGDVESMPITIDANNSTESQITITLNDDKGYPIVDTASTQAETPVSLQEIYASNAEDAHYRNRQAYISKFLAAGAAGQRHLYSSSDDVLSYEDILTAKKELTNAKAPSTNRYMAIPASAENALLKMPLFQSADKMGTAVVPTGVIGRIAGFWVIVFPDDVLSKTHIADGTYGVSGDEVETCYFYHKYAVAYARQIYKMVGPELSAGADAELWNLHCKQGANAQVTTFITTFRKSA